MKFYDEGFTLVEVLVTLLLLGIIAVGIFPVFGNIFSSIFSAGDKTNATYVNKEKIIDSIKNENNIKDSNLSIIVSTDPNDTSDDYEISSNGALQEVTTEYSKPNIDTKEDVTMQYYITTP
ncbi:MAG TPA: prepilin-type N-terminal cleavage/methylation domain-containing protein [Halanaerobiales bacterium]|nr:prepilin-type N-terminal cleavage/methylation domain-containing protein [Halanaerobiales bacterium]